MVLGKDSLYSGKIVIEFKVESFPEHVKLFLDFEGLSVKDMYVNDQKVKDSDLVMSHGRILLPYRYLISNGINKVSLKFENEYVQNSAGLHKFVDPVDQKSYFYTHLEPFFCHRWFPCFDQPSIRAPLKMTVVTPVADWNVYSNDIIK